MLKMKLDPRSIKNIKNKLNAMPNKMQKKAIRSGIDPEAKKILNDYKSITPVGKEKHKNKYMKRLGKGFLKKSFSVKNSGRGNTVGRKVVTRASGYYLFMSPNETGRKAGSKKGYSWGSIAGKKLYSKYWKARQIKVTNRVQRSLANELSKV